MKKRNIATLNFSLAASMDIGQAGVSIGQATTDTNQYIEQVAKKWDTANLAMPDADNSGMVIPEGLTLDPKNFLYVPFRLLTATVVGAWTWKAADFTKGSVLRKSMRKLLNKGVFTNHDMRPQNWLGFIAEVSWDKERVEGGKAIPAGINGVLAIDTTVERNKNVALGIMAGAIYSNSVSVEFEWEMSHNFDNDNEFRWHVGEAGQDGKMIRRNVTKIINFHETSLVTLGADPYAKRVDGDGNKVNIDEGSTYKELSKTEGFKATFSAATEAGKYKVTTGIGENIFNYIGKPAQGVGKPNKIDFKMNDKLKQLLITLLGVDNLEAVTDEQVEKLTILTKGKDMYTKLHKAALEATKADSLTLEGVEGLELLTKETKQGLDTKVTELTAALAKEVEEFAKLKVTLKDSLGDDFETTKENLEGLKKGAEYVESIQKLQRAEVKKLVRLSMGKNVDETALEIYDTANMEQIQATLKSYGAKVIEGFSASCGVCGSAKVKFVSSKPSTDPVTTTSNKKLTKNMAEIHKKYSSK